jgi:hypothetical protein
MTIRIALKSIFQSVLLLSCLGFRFSSDVELSFSQAITSADLHRIENLTGITLPPFPITPSIRYPVQQWVSGDRLSIRILLSLLKRVSYPGIITTQAPSLLIPITPVAPSSPAVTLPNNTYWTYQPPSLLTIRFYDDTTGPQDFKWLFKDEFTKSLQEKEPSWYQIRLEMGMIPKDIQNALELCPFIRTVTTSF